MTAETIALSPAKGLSSAFISDAPTDLFFYFFSVTAVVFAWFAATVMKVDSFVILATVAVIANGPHLVSTWTRVYFDKREWRARPFSLIGIPIAITATVLALQVTLGMTGARILNSTILYWATWHFVAQNWGLLRIYQRKSGEPLTSLAMRLERPILYLFVLWCLLKRIDTGPRVLFGTEVYYLPLPSMVVDALLGPLLFLIAVYVWQRVAEWNRPWAPAAALRGGFLFCAFLGFYIPFQCIKTDDTSAFAAAACWHGIQYLGIMRYYHRQTWKGGVHPDAKVISWLSQPKKGRLYLYAALLLALAGFGYVLIGALVLTSRAIFGDAAWSEYTWAATIWIGFTLSHYWLDGIIWKLRKPELAARVGL